MIFVLVLSLLGCGDTFGTLPSKDGGLSGPLKLGAFKLRERRFILPGVNSGPPPPEPGITRSQCKQLTDGGNVPGPDCLSGTIKCGQTIVGHTIGGTKRFGNRFYESNFCTPPYHDYNGGGERAYRFDLPDGPWHAVVTLDSPCANLDMAAMKIPHTSNECPSPKGMITQCEMWPDNISKVREKVNIVSDRPTSWLIVVEGQDNEEGAFSITVQCRPGLQ